jgi:putative transposase
MQAADQLSREVGVQRACEALAIPRASFYRWRQPPPPAENEPSPRRSPRALSPQERETVRQTLYSERFMDQAPRQVYATLLDENQYLCSVRTMYRILEQDTAAHERRNQLRHPNYQKPELLATTPNQVWSWDITKLLGPKTWTYYYLYVILDIFSRYVVGWMLAHGESGDLAARLIRESVAKQRVPEDELTIHSDRGPSMTSQSVAQLLATLGINKSHNRPHVSNDNPFSESQFKTMKYRPEFPRRFDSFEHALSFCREFFPWYNDEHYHSGIGLVTPAMLHYGAAPEVQAQRQQVLLDAYAAHPERFVNGMPKPPGLPTAVYINPPKGNDDSIQEKRLPEIQCPQKPDAPSTHPRLGYPSSSCVPAELDSVSPSTQQPSPLAQTPQAPANTLAIPQKIPGVWGLAPRDQPYDQLTKLHVH